MLKLMEHRLLMSLKMAFTSLPDDMLNASFRIVVTVLGIDTLVSDVQPLKADSPMVFTPSAMITLVSDWQL